VNVNYLPPEDYADLLRDSVMPIAPNGTNQVFLTDGTTTQANEAALLNAVAKHARDNNVSDASKLTVLGFKNGYHGNSIGTLSCSDSAANVQGVPTFDWPKAPFPEMKYPMAEYEHENRREEDRCLDEVRKIISSQRDHGKDVAALIIEPITALNNQMATPYFYKQLRKITKENGVAFVVDETKTGVGSTGKMWAHEHWFLKDTPDIVTFGGKAGISGYYTNVDFKLETSRFPIE
jgi:4-aminobutyrate aminotransferase/(S)-3-amino-2-methylpropionate transaminase